MVTYIYNPSYLGGEDKKNCCLRPGKKLAHALTHTKKSETPSEK
jgi:hypothetical protein